MSAALVSRSAAKADASTHLRLPGGSRTFSPKSKFGPMGLAVMIVAHLLIGYVLATGLAGKAIEIIKKPLDATIIQEVKLPPPPPPPPPKQIVKQEVPKPQAPPPPAYVPPPDVAPPATPAPSISAVQSIEPVAPPAALPPPPPAPPAPDVPAKLDIALACPKQFKPEMPQKAIDDGIGGTVKAEATIRGGRIVEVRILSGPRAFHTAVRAAMLRYECATTGEASAIATQEFTFKVE